MKEENIFISWFYMYHGMAFFKHSMAVFSTQQPNKNMDFSEEYISQKKMQYIFDNQNLKPFFSKMYILYPSKDVYKQHTGKSYNFRKSAMPKNDEEIKESGTADIWVDIINQNLSIQEEFQYIKKIYPEKAELLYEQYWRNIQHYLPEEQIWWLMEKSNLPKEFKERTEFIDINKKYNFTDLWDYRKISEVTYKEVSLINKKHKNANFYINVTLSTKETQVTWFSLSQGGFLPKNTTFIESYDKKNINRGKRFKDFFLRKIPSNILDLIKQEVSELYTKPAGKKRELTNYLFKSYLKEGFAITLMGERGIGKTNIIKDKKDVETINCAIFDNNDIGAESTIFGYAKGAFKGATKREDGVFHKARTGILIFDEISSLSKSIQFRLMQALVTDKADNFQIRRMGENKIEKVKCSVIFTTSKSVPELRDKLLPELFDRIMQLVIELPPLRETPEEIPLAFENIWKQMQFEDDYPFKKNIPKEVIDWIKTLPLYGNYRDLQRIAIHFKSHLAFLPITKELLKEKTAFEYTKNQYAKYIEEKTKNIPTYFSSDKTTKNTIECFKKDLSTWLISRFGSAKKAVKHLEKKGEKITEKTLYTWKNYK